MNARVRPARAKTASAVRPSRVLRFRAGKGEKKAFAWRKVPITQYKLTPGGHCGVTRSILAGVSGEQTSFHVRYFEVAPGGFTTLEHHRHEHVVIVFRGKGRVRLGDKVHRLAVGDAVYVAPHEVHQFRNADPAEPFGFFCMVDAQRDRPTEVVKSGRRA